MKIQLTLEDKFHGTKNDKVSLQVKNCGPNDLALASLFLYDVLDQKLKEVGFAGGMQELIKLQDTLKINSNCNFIEEVKNEIC